MYVILEYNFSENIFNQFRFLQIDQTTCKRKIFHNMFIYNIIRDRQTDPVVI